MANKTFQTAHLDAPSTSPISKSHLNISTMDIMQMRVPYIEECVPNDDIDVDISSYFRAAPLQNAIYGNYSVVTAAFFVPHRVVWKKFPDFITGGATGQSSYTPPFATLNEIIARYKAIYPSGSSRDYDKLIKGRNTYDLLSDLGIPMADEEFNITLNNSNYTATYTAPKHLNFYNLHVNMLPFRALNRIWWDWFRDSNLISDDLESQYNDTSDSHVGQLNSNKYLALSGVPVPFEKDYFTTAFTDPQRGAASVVPVHIADTSLNPNLQMSAGGQPIYAANHSSGNNPQSVYVRDTGDTGNPANDILGKFEVLALRSAKALQRFLEKNNIAGASKLTQLLSHWGVAPSPIAFNMSEYIGKTEHLLNIDEVISNASTDYGSLGETVTKINGSTSSHFSYHAKEHGFFIVCSFIRPERIYKGAFPRYLFNRTDKFDYYTPEFENVSFQPIYSREILFRGSGNGDTTHVFGYAPRYAEYKFAQSRYTGGFCRKDMERLLLNDSSGDDHYQGNVISTAFTADAGTNSFDTVFQEPTPWLDHFQVRWRIDCGMRRPMQPYGMASISDITGTDISIPYAGVRL